MSGDDRIRIRVIDFGEVKSLDDTTDVKTIISTNSQIIDNIEHSESSIGFYIFNLALNRNTPLENGYMYEREVEGISETLFLFKFEKGTLFVYAVSDDGIFLINNKPVLESQKEEVSDGDLLDLSGNRFVINCKKKYDSAKARKVIGKFLVEKASTHNLNHIEKLKKEIKKIKNLIEDKEETLSEFKVLEEKIFSSKKKISELKTDLERITSETEQLEEQSRNRESLVVRVESEIVNLETEIELKEKELFVLLKSVKL